jgi:prepilin signal peptidase PulO-like enzyme (type II secretory pathway)
LGLSYFIGGLFSIISLARGVHLKDPIPFAPFLVLGCLLSCMDLLSRNRFIFF